MRIQREVHLARRPDVMTRELPRWLNALLVVGTVAAVVVLEIRRPLRQSREPKLERDSRNAVLSLLAAATVALAEKPVLAPLSLAVQQDRRGLLKLVRLPRPVELFLSVLLLDYTLYIWHRLTHRVPLLWRFHKVHHADLDMDASTALRFHVGELLFSVPWRAAQVRLLGVSPLGLAIWQTVTLMEILFHHANLRLPLDAERSLCRVMVTPRMHGIHHSVIKKEADSNFSTIFCWPDRLHGTLRLNVPQNDITIGVAGYQDPEQLGLGSILEMPFGVDSPVSMPERAPLQLPRTTLAG